jgi:hypothetical protein
MSNRNRTKGKLPPFVPLIKETMKTPAWIALSIGAKALYPYLRWNYNTKLQNHVWLSHRDAAEQLSVGKNRPGRWFHELEHYGFIVMVNPGGLGVEGHGKAPHYRLTEAWYLGKPPTRDFLLWDGTLYVPPNRSRKNQSACPYVGDSLSRRGGQLRPARPKKPGRLSRRVGHTADPDCPGVWDITRLTSGEGALEGDTGEAAA